MSFKQSLLALIKKSLLISRLDILHVKALLHSFEKGRKGLNTDKICKIISHMIICLQNLFMYYVWTHSSYTRYTLLYHEC